MLRVCKSTWTTQSLPVKIAVVTLAFGLCGGPAGSLRGQSRPHLVPSRITQPINERAIVRLRNTTHPSIRVAKDMGRVEPDLPMERILLMLKSSLEQEAMLDQLLVEQQDPASPNYHHWLMPEEFGERFGASTQELDLIVAWLSQRGFTVNSIANSRREIEFSGTAAQVEEAFHTEMHRYGWNGENHIANATDISIPVAMVGIVEGIEALHDFHARPMMTLTDGLHFMTPHDFATIYNITPLWNLGFDGKGQSIAIVARSNINVSDVAAFRAQFGLPMNNPQIILNGPDPGIAGDDEGEADLDVEWAGAVAKDATIKLVVSKSTTTTDGVALSMNYIVNNNVAPIVSVSFGDCEADFTSGEIQMVAQLWAQASAQGMSVFVSSGDSGSATCDASSISRGTEGLAVNALASTPFTVAVGGTRFDEKGSDSSYWNKTNSFANLSSVRGYIPEVVWNDAKDYGVGLFSTGGGVSTVSATPSWQVGYGVPTVDPGTTNQHHRYLPDVSLSASGHDGYVIWQDGQFGAVYGTSASAPAFAGIMAMINQMTGEGNGNPNPRLYAIANEFPSVFHDITTGTNAVPCVNGTKDCLNGSTNGYSAGPGYDLTTGWGSVDAFALAHAWALSTSRQ